jgi:hypothetical protein
MLDEINIVVLEAIMPCPIFYAEGIPICHRCESRAKCGRWAKWLERMNRGERALKFVERSVAAWLMSMGVIYTVILARGR